MSQMEKMDMLTCFLQVVDLLEEMARRTANGFIPYGSWPADTAAEFDKVKSCVVYQKWDDEILAENPTIHYPKGRDTFSQQLSDIIGGNATAKVSNDSSGLHIRVSFGPGYPGVTIRDGVWHV